jgi:hypothetical protein
MAKSTNLIRALVITAKIRGTRARILIDSKCLNNFVFPNFVEKAQFYIQAKEYQYTLYRINDQLIAENGETVIKKIISISIDI